MRRTGMRPSHTFHGKHQVVHMHVDEAELTGTLGPRCESIPLRFLLVSGSGVGIVW